MCWTATTIIESGIDMPNVNTIIVIDAQNFDCDLHQLRGRVGEATGKHSVIYCSLYIHLVAAAVCRLLRTLQNWVVVSILRCRPDIRGAGNLLGAEQSGFIADLGYETYRKILPEK